MNNDIFDNSYLAELEKECCPDVEELRTVVQSLNVMLSDTVVNYQSFKYKLDELNHGKVVSFTEDILCLSDNVKSMIKQLEKEYQFGKRG